MISETYIPFLNFGGWSSRETYFSYKSVTSITFPVIIAFERIANRFDRYTGLTGMNFWMNCQCQSLQQCDPESAKTRKYVDLSILLEPCRNMHSKYMHRSYTKPWQDSRTWEIWNWNEWEEMAKYRRDRPTGDSPVERVRLERSFG